MNRLLVFALGFALGEVVTLVTMFVLPIVHRDAGQQECP